MATQTNYRIEGIERVRVNGRNVKIFTVYVRNGDAYVHAGKLTASVKTANRDLWKVAVEHGL